MSVFSKRKIKKVFNYVYNGIKHKADVFKLYLDWILFSKKRFKNALKQIDDDFIIHPFKVRKWHNGTSVFIAKSKNGKKVFIKRCFNKRAIFAEINAINTLEDISIKENVKVCKLLYSDKDYGFIIEEYIDGKPLSDNEMIKTLSMTEKVIIINELYNILLLFHSIGFVHSDFTPKNIFLTKEKQLCVIDFEFSALYSAKMSNKGAQLITSNKRILCSLGGAFSLKNGIIDDGYSLLQVAKYLLPDLIEVDYPLWRKINEQIGVLQLDVKNSRFTGSMVK